MFCPKCGTADQQIDSYCKRCGEWLPDTSRIGLRRGRLRASTPEQRHRKLQILEGASALFAVSAAVILYGFLAGRFGISQVALAAELCIVIAFVQIIALAIGRSLSKRLKQGRDDEHRALYIDTVKDARQLNQAKPDEFLSASSVTEGTTALLESTPRSGQSPR